MRQTGPARHGSLGRLGSPLPLAVLALLLVPTSPARSEVPTKERITLWGYARGTAFLEPRGVAFDPKDGAIYVSNTGAHTIEVFSKLGRPLGRFIHRVTRPTGEVTDGRPTAIAFDGSGRLLVVDQLASYVDVLDRRLHPVTRLPIPAGHPSALAVGGNGTIYVGTSTEASRVYRFRPDYAPDGDWGQPGTAPGTLLHVAGLAVLGDTAIAVACERTDLAIQIFSPTGEYLRGFGTHEVGDENFSLPSGLLATADGRLWAIDDIRRTLHVFDAAGTLTAVVTGTGTPRGGFDHPSALSGDGRGSLAVADRGIGRVQVFDILASHDGGASQQPQQ
jgi:DNA-binding beta-propeller fold protein YncE